MERKTYLLLDAVCREGLTNDMWGVVEDVSSNEWFGGKESYELHGQFLYVYLQKDDGHEEMFESFTPDYIIHDMDGTYIYLYQLR